MKYLYSYTLSLPLTYCTYDLRSDDSEFVLGLAHVVEWDEPHYIETQFPLDESKMFSATENIHFCLSSKFAEEVSDDENYSLCMPDKFFVCTVSGIVAETKVEARKLVDASIIKACKSLSILMSCNNCNKQGYQPRVEPDYKQQEWKKEKYEPYEKLVREVYKTQTFADENGNTIINAYADFSNILVGESVHITIFGDVDATHFFDFYHYENSSNLSFLLDEYYTALGRESIVSKFFHLFSIIEYVEKEFVDLADTRKVFDEEDKKRVLECLEQLNMPKEKLDRLRGTVMSAMSKATEIGREAKLVNILHNMGIKEFTECGTPFVVDKDGVKQLTALRNSYFHGDGKKVGGTEKHISVEAAVARLMYICEKIIIYVMRNTDIH